MFNLRKVVVTGVGCISPLGPDVQSTWEGLLAGRNGVSQITRFDPGELASRIAGQADDFDPELRLAPKEARRMDRFIQLGLCAGGFRGLWD